MSLKSYTKKSYRSNIFGNADILVVWLVLASINILNHHLIPMDETRYASVAWEMWHRQDFLVPQLNGIPYHHKPPLLFWIFDLGWWLFGVNETWLLIVSPLCGLISLYILRYLARLLWPHIPAISRMAPWILFGSLLWGAFMNSVMFDTLLTASVLVAITGLIHASQNFRWHSWGMFALGCGLGLLTKGPVIFVHILVPFLSGIFWSESIKENIGRWYLQGSVSILAGILIALCWVIPAITAAGDNYGGTLLWHQTVDRMTNSFAHSRSWTWYLMLSPVIFFPWFFWPRVWKNFFNRELFQDLSFRFCLIWFISGFIEFSMISGKQVHYLIPLFPALALILGRILPTESGTAKPGDFLPFAIITIFALLLLTLPFIPDLNLYHWVQTRKLWWALLLLLIGVGGVSRLVKTKSISPYHLSMIVLMGLTVSLPGFFASTGNAFNLRQTAQQVETYLNTGSPIAWSGKYEGQLQFLLQLTQPVEVIEKYEILSWLQSHPKGRVISIEKPNKIPPPSLNIEYKQHYREGKVLWIQSLH